MRLLASMRNVLWTLTHRSRVNDELDEELRAHIALRADDLVRSGIPRPEAERQARVEFGGFDRYMEASHEAAGSLWGESILHDLRFGLRMLWKSPVLTAAAIATLAIGIGANTAMFSLVDGLWLRPLAIADPAHVVAISSVKNHAASDSEEGDIDSSYAEYRDVRERTSAFADVAASSKRGIALETSEGLQMLLATVVSDNYFTFMGARPEVGRVPIESDWHDPQAPVIVLSHSTWMRVFAGDARVVGQTFNVKGGRATIAAVLPPQFRGTERLIESGVYVPQSTWVAWHPDERNLPRTDREYELYARLKPGATLDQARPQLERLSRDLSTDYPQANQDRTLSVAWQSRSSSSQLKVVGTLLLVLAGAVLMMACANIASLLLARNDSRTREMAIRYSLGATRRRLFQQMLTECAILGAAGIAVAVLLASWLIASVPALLPNIGFPLSFDFRIDHRVLLFTMIAGVLSVLICGVPLGIIITRTAPLEAARTHASPARLKMPARKIFVVLQAAATIALLMATGLLLRTLIAVQKADIGFNRSQNAVLMQINVDWEGPRRIAEFDALAARMRALPGVKDACVARVAPFALSGGGATRFVLAPGEQPGPAAGTPVWFNWVDDAYFHVLGVPLVRGRAFEHRDSTAAAPVAIVNQALARRLFATDDAVGKHLRVGRDQPQEFEIIGVAQDGKYAGITEAPQPYLYLPFTQDSWAEVTLIVTATKDARPLLPAVRKAVRDVSPNIMILYAQTMTDRIGFATYPSRMAAWLTAVLALLALLLAMIGLYGVGSYSVSRRVREIGIRMALGAPRNAAFKTVLNDGLKLTLSGILLGTGLALLLGRGMSSLLYGVTPFDPITLSGVVFLVLATSTAALLGPARRALRIDPANTLRED